MNAASIVALLQRTKYSDDFLFAILHNAEVQQLTGSCIDKHSNHTHTAEKSSLPQTLRYGTAKASICRVKSRSRRRTQNEETEHRARGTEQGARSRGKMKWRKQGKELKARGRVQDQKGSRRQRKRKRPNETEETIWALETILLVSTSFRCRPSQRQNKIAKDSLWKRTKSTSHGVDKVWLCK